MKDIFFQISQSNNLLLDLSKDSSIYFIINIKPKIKSFLIKNEKLYQTHTNWVDEKLENALRIMFIFDFENSNETTFFEFTSIDQRSLNWFFLLIDFYFYLTNDLDSTTELLNTLSLYFEKCFISIKNNHLKSELQKVVNSTLEFRIQSTDCKFQDILSESTVSYIKNQIS